METAQRFDTHEAKERFRLVFAYRVEGDLRFISHDNVLRLFRRALARAALPVRFSEGFNPQPRIRIPLPRPVGIASEAEYVIIEFEHQVDPDDALRRLEQQTPAGICMISARRLGLNEALQPALVRYRLEPDGPLPADAGQRLRGILDSDVLYVQRRRYPDNKTDAIDIRPYLATMQMNGDAVEFTLRVTPNGTARPAEIAALWGYETAAINHRIRRMEVKWQ